MTSRKLLTAGLSGGLLVYLIAIVATIILGKGRPRITLIIIPPLILLAIPFGHLVKHLCKKIQLIAQDDPSNAKDSNDPERTV